MSDSKTHYRKVFKSDHLSVADLEEMAESGSKLIFTIKNCRQEMGVSVAGRKGNFNIAYFTEGIKPLVLNATNSKTMRSLTGSQWIEDWSNITVQLYIDHDAKMGENIGGVRINQRAPKIEKRFLNPDNKKDWANAIAAFKRDGDLKAVLERRQITEENRVKLMEEANPENPDV